MDKQTVWARDTRGVWHIATATYPAHAETLCKPGRAQTRCIMFTLRPRDHDLRPETCPVCESLAL